HFRCCDFRLRRRLWLFVGVRLRWWRQCYLLQLWFGSACGQLSVFVGFRCSRKLSALSRKLALPLAEKFAHVFRHVRSLWKVFLLFVFQKRLHEVDEHRQRAFGAGHVIAEWFLLAGITHPDARDV